MAKHALVPLDRRFHDIGDGDELEHPDVGARLLVPGEPWSVVLGHPCAVILGEAGSGKTTEFKLRHEALVAEGAVSFAFTVEDLAILGVDGSLVGAARDRFTGWKASKDEAYFFLDSVDEAHLSGQRLSSALKRFEHEAAEALTRSHVLISCRVSDWRAETDRATVDSILFADADMRERRKDSTSTATEDEGRRRSRVRVYALAPLTEAQVEALASILGVRNPRGFTEAAKRAAAHAYLERPRDVEWLAGYWQQHGDIGTLTNLIEHDIREKLVERNAHPSRAPKLPPKRAREAAEILAGILTLERRSTIRLPDGDLDADRAGNTLDPGRVLPDFSKEDLRELLTLPLFDEATYGRVRVHHRSITEYLAAQWLLKLLRAGMADSEVDRLIFRPTVVGPAVPSELAAVAAWLAGTSSAVRIRLLSTAPAVLLQGGDPNSLPDDTRRELLVALAHQYRSRERLFQSFDRVMLQRLATGAIGDTVAALLDNSTQSELLETLFGIVEEGQLYQCAGAALRVALDGLAPRHARTAAIRALARVAAPDMTERLLANSIDHANEIDHDIGGALVGGFYPGAMSIERLIALIQRVKGPPPQTGTLLPYYLGHNVPEATPAKDKARVIEAVLELVQVADNRKAFRSTWLLEPLVQMISDLVSTQRGANLQSVLPALRFFAGIGPGGRMDPEIGGDGIRTVIAANADLKREVFWNDVASIESAEEPTNYFQLLGRDRLWELSDADGEWLAQDARMRASPSERLLAFDCLLRLPGLAGAEAVREQAIRELVDREPAFKARLEAMSERSRPMPPDRKADARKRREEAKDQKVREENLEWLTAHLDGIRDGSDQHALILMAQRTFLDGEEPEKALQRIADEFGEPIASAVRGGWRRLWRGLTCPLPHEERGSFQYLMLAGFAGVTLDAAAGLDFARLTREEAVTAARFASRGMNHFPPWLTELASRQPAAVTEVFATCLAADYDMSSDEQPAYGVLALLPHASEAVRATSSPTVFELLRRAPPPRLDSLKHAIELIIASPWLHDSYVALAPQRCAATKEEADHYALWWSAWLAADPTAALGALEATLHALAQDADGFMVRVAHQLWPIVNDRRVSFPFPAGARELGRLALLLFRHVRPDEDVRHLGVYSPGPRDHAESLRRAVLALLERTPGEETYRALRALAAEPSVGTWSDYFLSLADTRLANDAGRNDPEVANKLIRACETYGLEAIKHLEESGLMTTEADIGIVTIREDEFQAVLAAFPESLGRVIGKSKRHYNIRSADAGNGKTYRVAIVRLIEQGNGEAQAGARDLLDDVSPKLLLVVGIAGGVPSDDFTLGDVVVATRINDYTVHLAGHDGEAEFDIAGGPIDRGLAASVANLRARVEMRDWSAHLAARPFVDSAAVGTYGPDEWQKRVRKCLAHHFNGGAPSLPDFHACAIGSSDAFIKDANLLIMWLETARKLGAVEMEAAGVYRATRDRCAMLAIRGISDIVGLNRDDVRGTFTTYACESAAAFARAYLATSPV